MESKHKIGEFELTIFVYTYGNHQTEGSVAIAGYCHVPSAKIEGLKEFLSKNRVVDVKNTAWMETRLHSLEPDGQWHCKIELLGLAKAAEFISQRTGQVSLAAGMSVKVQEDISWLSEETGEGQGKGGSAASLSDDGSI